MYKFAFHIYRGALRGKAWHIQGGPVGELNSLKSLQFFVYFAPLGSNGAGAMNIMQEADVILLQQTKSTMLAQVYNIYAETMKIVFLCQLLYHFLVAHVEVREILPWFMFLLFSTIHCKIYGMISSLLDPCNSRHSINNVSWTTLWFCNWDGYSFHQWNGECFVQV